jgi:zinc transporter ZupT
MVSAESASAEIASAVLVSLAAGSFLYIGLIEILPKELEKPCSKTKSYIKLFLMAFGWGFMAFIAKFA